MRLKTVCGIAVLLTASGCASAQNGSSASPSPPAAAPSPNDNPHWARLPGGHDFAAVYPWAAARQHISGHSTMRCSVTKEGMLENCMVVEETPPHLGFGAAELKLAAKFRMHPLTRGGRSVGGGVVTVPVGWRPIP